MPKTMTMVNDKGEAYDVPLTDMPNALRSGLKVAIDMKHAGTGDRYVIPREEYQHALANGLVPDNRSSVPEPGGLAGPDQKSAGQKLLDMLNYPLMSKLSPTYTQDRAKDEALAQPNTPYEQEHPVLGYIRRKLAQGAMVAEDAITPGTVATSALSGGARMLGGLPGVAGRVGQGATLANRGLSGVYGATAAKSGYDAATNDQLTPTQRALGGGLGALGAVLGAVDLGVGKPAAAPLQKSAEKTYSRFLNPTRVDTKAMTQEIVPGLLEQGQQAASLGSLSDAASQKLSDIGAQIDQHAASIPETVRPDMNQIMNDVKQHQASFSVGGKVVNQAGHDNAQRVVDTLSQFENPSFQDMRSVRQIMDQPVAEAGAYAGRPVADQSYLNAQKAGANAVRAELARQSPDLAELNKQYNFWSMVKDVADASADRKVGQKGFMRAVLPTIATSAGFSHGGVAGGLETLVPTAIAAGYTTPLGQTLRANAKAIMARALSGADIGTYGRLGQRALAGDLGQYADASAK